MTRTPIWFVRLAMVLLALPATAAPAAKAEELELQVSLNDKKVGTETLRTQSGQEGRYDSIDATLQDKVAKVWKAFQQRAALDREANGTMKGYRRGVYVKGATISTNLFAYNGNWRVGAQAEAGSKPKVLTSRSRRRLSCWMSACSRWWWLQRRPWPRPGRPTTSAWTTPRTGT